MNNYKFKVGDFFKFSGQRFEVTICDAFGATPHYGVLWVTSRGCGNCPSHDYHSGWLPSGIVDQTAKLVTVF